ncbi:MAG: sensor signal transduction histidine kinase, partial [Polaromonas sp.]|nr:sensor signal transduction histidine kinase [Polaromonas sp.]
MRDFSLKGIKAKQAGGGEKAAQAVAAGGQSAHEMVSQGLILLDGKGQITDINANALKLLRCSLTGLPGRDFWEAVPEEIAERHQSTTGKALALSSQHSFTVHREFEDSWLEYSFSRQANGFSVSLRDVTTIRTLEARLERSEQHNHFLFHANPNAMWIFDLESLRILAVNEAAIAFYGISRKAFLKLKMGALFPDGEGASLLSAVSSVNAVGEVQLAPQICKQKKMDGQLLLVEMACGRINWEDRKAVLVSIVDVAERHLADRALRRENADMEQQLADLQGELVTTRRDLS